MARPSRISGLMMDMRQGEVINIGNNIKIHFLEKSGRVTRVRVAAPVEVRIHKDSCDGDIAMDRVVPSMPK
jgi:sRNA-binding carbon storage regulator CsrA